MFSPLSIDRINVGYLTALVVQTQRKTGSDVFQLMQYNRHGKSGPCELWRDLLLPETMPDLSHSIA